MADYVKSNTIQYYQVYIATGTTDADIIGNSYTVNYDDFITNHNITLYLACYWTSLLQAESSVAAETYLPTCWVCDSTGSTYYDGDTLYGFDQGADGAEQYISGSLVEGGIFFVPFDYYDWMNEINPNSSETSVYTIKITADATYTHEYDNTLNSSYFSATLTITPSSSSGGDDEEEEEETGTTYYVTGFSATDFLNQAGRILLYNYHDMSCIGDWPTIGYVRITDSSGVISTTDWCVTQTSSTGNGVVETPTFTIGSTDITSNFLILRGVSSSNYGYYNDWGDTGTGPTPSTFSRSAGTLNFTITMTDNDGTGWSSSSNTYKLASGTTSTFSKSIIVSTIQYGLTSSSSPVISLYSSTDNTATIDLQMEEYSSASHVFLDGSWSSGLYPEVLDSGTYGNGIAYNIDAGTTSFGQTTFTLTSSSIISSYYHNPILGLNRSLGTIKFGRSSTTTNYDLYESCSVNVTAAASTEIIVYRADNGNVYDGEIEVGETVSLYAKVVEKSGCNTIMTSSHTVNWSTPSVIPINSSYFSVSVTSASTSLDGTTPLYFTLTCNSETTVGETSTLRLAISSISYGSESYDTSIYNSTTILTAAEPSAVPITSFVIYEHGTSTETSAVTILPNSTFEFDASILPTNHTETITWSTSDSNVFTIDTATATSSYCKITSGTSAGSATLTAAGSISGALGTVAVTVTSEPGIGIYYTESGTRHDSSSYSFLGAYSSYSDTSIPIYLYVYPTGSLTAGSWSITSNNIDVTTTGHIELEYIGMDDEKGKYQLHHPTYNPSSNKTYTVTWTASSPKSDSTYPSVSFTINHNHEVIITEPTFTVSPTSLSYTYDDDGTTAKTSSVTCSYKADGTTVNANWKLAWNSDFSNNGFSVKVGSSTVSTSGATFNGTQTVSVYAPSDIAESTRTGTLTLTPQGHASDAGVKTISVSKAGRSASFDPTSKSINWNATGTYSTTYTSNQAWSITSGSASWITDLSPALNTSQSASTDGAAVSFKVTDTNYTNPSNQTERTFTITTDANKTFTLTQGAWSPSISCNSASFTAAGGNQTITVTSNYAWAASVTSGSDWLSLGTTSGGSNSTGETDSGTNITLTASINSDKDNGRSAVITFTCPNYTDYVDAYTVTITQAAAVPDISVSTNTVNLGALIDYSSTLTVTSAYGGWRCSVVGDDTSELVISPTSASWDEDDGTSVTTTVTITWGPYFNTSEGRSCTITFYNTVYTTKSKTVTIQQDKANVFFIVNKSNDTSVWTNLISNPTDISPTETISTNITAEGGSLTRYVYVAPGTAEAVQFSCSISTSLTTPSNADYEFKPTYSIGNRTTISIDGTNYYIYELTVTFNKNYDIRDIPYVITLTSSINSSITSRISVTQSGADYVADFIVDSSNNLQGKEINVYGETLNILITNNNSYDKLIIDTIEFDSSISLNDADDDIPNSYTVITSVPYTIGCSYKDKTSTTSSISVKIDEYTREDYTEGSNANDKDIKKFRLIITAHTESVSTRVTISSSAYAVQYSYDINGREAFESIVYDPAKVTLSGVEENQAISSYELGNTSTVIYSTDTGTTVTILRDDTANDKDKFKVYNEKLEEWKTAHPLLTDAQVQEDIDRMYILEGQLLDSRYYYRLS